MLEVSSFYVLFYILISQFCCCRNFEATNIPSVLLIARLCLSRGVQSMNAFSMWEGSHWLPYVIRLEQRVVNTVRALEMGSSEPGHGNGYLRRVMNKSNDHFPFCFPLSMHTWLTFPQWGNLFIFAEVTEGKNQLKQIHHKIIEIVVPEIIVLSLQKNRTF